MRPMCGAGSSRIAATARATSTDETGEVLLAPCGSASSSASHTRRGEKQEEAFQEDRRPHRDDRSSDHDSACSASQCSLCCGLSVVSVMLICVTVICDMFTNASTP